MKNVNFVPKDVQRIVSSHKISGVCVSRPSALGPHLVDPQPRDGGRDQF